AEDQPVARDARVVHEDVEPALPLDHPVDRRLERGGVAHVDREDARRPGARDLLDLRGGLLEWALAAGRQDDATTVLRETKGDGLADAAARAGDQGDASDLLC